ncbi:hypothetical protein [Flavobacterium covae]|uniref:hypothetical protein n=1 Tax=Flavobacterium covae TaxID=2906076 RepID=UPI003394F758
MSIDPLAEIAPNKSPYHFVSNNPINRIDPLGLTDYKVNGETRTIDDGHNDLSMTVSQKEFNKLEKKFEKGDTSYERYMNKISVKNGFTTTGTYTDSEATGGIGVSITQHKAGGDSYSDWSLSNSVSEKLTGGNDILGTVLDATGKSNSAVGILSKQVGYQLSAFKLGTAIQNDKQTFGYQTQLATGQVVGGIAGGATGAYIGQEIGGWIGGGVGFLSGGMGAIPGVLIGKAVGGAIGAYFGSEYGSEKGKTAANYLGEKLEK